MVAPLILLPASMPVLHGQGPLADEHREATQCLLGLMAKRNDMLVVQVSGLRGREGASTIASSLARALLHVSGRQVIHLRVASSDDANQTGRSGTLLKSTVRKFLAQGMREGLAKAIPCTDLVIIDSLPLLTSVESAALAAQTDGVILVIEGDQSSYDELRNAQLAIESAGGRILGVILNKRRYRVPRLIGKLTGIPVSRRPRRGAFLGALAGMFVAAALIWLALLYVPSLMDAVRTFHPSPLWTPPGLEGDTDLNG